jgi:hypothetical protein
MQRITRYSLLLRQILHYTTKEHPHYDACLISLQMSEEFLDEVNWAIKLKQSKSNINRITKTVDLDIPTEVSSSLIIVLQFGFEITYKVYRGTIVSSRRTCS